MTSTTAAPQTTPSPFPTPTKSQTLTLLSHPTTITTLSFTDRLLITISQNGLINHWVHVPLSSSSSLDPSLSAPPTFSQSDQGSGEPGTDLLPRRELTATTILGGTKREEEVFGQMLGTTIGSAVLDKREREGRLLVLGVGFERGVVEKVGRGEWEEVVGAVLEGII